MRSIGWGILVLAMPGAALLGACGHASAGSPAPTDEALVGTPRVLDWGTPVATAASPLYHSSPTARRGLEATDPTTVSLDGGRPTLVEFFAFW
jgi:hypothetical protein